MMPPLGSKGGHGVQRLVEDGMAPSIRQLCDSIEELLSKRDGRPKYTAPGRAAPS
jgi:hypothetical protein